MPDADCTLCNVQSLRIIILCHCVLLNVRKILGSTMQKSHAGSYVKYGWERVCLQTLATLAVQTGYSRLHVLDMGEDMGVGMG